MIKVKGEGRFGPMIYMDNDFFVGRAMENYGEYKYFAIDLLARLVKEDDVIVDVGANIGTFTVPFARLVPKGYLIAFEAQPTIFNILCGNVAINNLFNVTTAQRAVANSDGEPLYVPETNYAGKPSDFSEIQLVKQRDGNFSMLAHTIKIDSLGLAKLKLLKVNANGMELDVLKGGLETIKRANPIIYVSTLHTGVTQIKDLLSGLGYKCRVHEFPMFNPENYNKNSMDIFKDSELEHSSNLFCYPVAAEASLKPLFDMPYFKEEQQSGCPWAGSIKPVVEWPAKSEKKNLSVESSELTLELPKIYAKEE